MGRLTWWQGGLVGGFVLSYATAVKLVRALRKGQEVDAEWAELPGFAAALFGIGFLCGVIVWFGQQLYTRFGRLGDALVGLAVMPTFFLSCMLAFSPELLKEKITGGATMLGLAVLMGPFIGVWLGSEWRKGKAPAAAPRREQYRAPTRRSEGDNPFEL
jgi:hypothetical protein